LCYTGHVDDFLPISSLPQGSSGNPYPLVNYITCDNFSKSHRAFLATITKVVEPKYCHEAIKDSPWHQAMIEEINALEANKIWNIADLPSGKHPSLVNGLQSEIQV